MGSAPSLPEVDLLPPRFSSPPSVLDKASQSPLDVLFGEQDRRTLFNDFYGTNLRLGLSPDDATDVTIASNNADSLATMATATTAQFALTSADGHGLLYKAGGRFSSTSIEPFAVMVDPSSRTSGFVTATRGADTSVAFGARYFNASDTMSLGFRMEPMADRNPLTLHGVAALTGSVLAGVEVGASTDGLDMKAVRYAVSYTHSPRYQMFLACSTATSELTAGFFHQATLWRKVRNPMEESHVRGIWNYFDLGFELNKGLGPLNNATGVTVGCGWQPNKGLLVKGKLSDNAAEACVAWRPSWDPLVTLGVSAKRASAGSETETTFGLSLSFAQGSAPPTFLKPEKYSQRMVHNQTFKTQQPTDGAFKEPVQPRDGVWQDPNAPPRPPAPVQPPFSKLM